MLIYEYKLDGTKAQYARIDEAIRVEDLGVAPIPLVSVHH